MYNDLLKSSLKAYNSYTANFAPSFSLSKSSSKNLLDTHSNMLQESYARRAELESNRSLLDRGFDLLLAPLYTTAGFARGLVNPNFTPLEGAVQGIKASNPFGKGFEQGEHSYSAFLEDLGWKPESTLGKIAKGTAGFVLDVALDPTTYLSGGASAVIKGTGKVAMSGKVAELSHDVARGIVEATSAKRGLSLTAEQIEKDSSKLVKEFNRLSGIRSADENPITFGLGNFPFGEKLFGKYGTTRVISDGNTLRELGDNTIAPLYAELRNSIYGSQLGKMFSTKSKLFDLAKENPSKLYDTLKFMDVTMEHSKDKLLAKRAIVDKAKEMNFTPSETKELLDYLQDSTLWNRVKTTFKFLDTIEAKHIQKQLEQDKQRKATRLAELEDEYKNLQTMRTAHESELLDAKDILKKYEDEYDDQLLKLLDEFKPHEEEYKRARELVQKRLDEFDAKNTEVEDKRAVITSTFDEYQNFLNARNEDKARMKMLKLAVGREQVEIPTNTVKKYKKWGIETDDHMYILHRAISEEEPELQKLLGDYLTKDGKLRKSSYQRRIGLDANGKPLYEDVKVDQKDFQIRLQEYVQKNYEKYIDVDARRKVENKVDDFLREHASRDGASPVSDSRAKLVDSLNDYLFDGEEVIRKSAWDSHIEDLVKAIRNDVPKDELVYIVERNHDYYTGKATEIFRFIGEVLGYGKGHKYENWAEMYHDRMKSIIEFYEQTGKLSPQLQRQLEELHKLKDKRNMWLRRFKGKSFDEIKAIKQKYYNEQLDKTYKEVETVMDSTGATHLGRDADEIRRARYNAEDRAFSEGGSHQIVKKKDKDGNVIDDEFEVQVNDEVGGWDRRTHEFRDYKADSKFSPRERQKLLLEFFDEAPNQFKRVDGKLHEVTIDAKGNTVYIPVTKTQTEILQSQKQHFERLINEMELIIERGGFKNWNDLTLRQHDLIKKVAKSNLLNKDAGNKGFYFEDTSMISQITKSMKIKDYDTLRHAETVKWLKSNNDLIIRDGSEFYRGRVTKVHYQNGRVIGYDFISQDGKELYKLPTSSFVKVAGLKYKNVDELMLHSDVAKETVLRREDFVKQLEKDLSDAESKLKLAKQDYLTRKTHVVETLRKAQDDVLKLEAKHQEFSEKLAHVDVSELESLRNSVKHYEELLQNADALENYARTLYGDDFVKNLKDKFDENDLSVAELVINDLPTSEKIKNMVKFFRDEMIRMGEGEVNIGKLDVEAFEYMMWNYLPRIATEEGEAFFKGHKLIRVPDGSGGFTYSIEKRALKDTETVTQDYAFGVKFNPYGKERSIDAQMDIREINEWFKEKTGIDKVFHEELADIYIARGLKHEDLMYDDKYMRTMLETFGDDVPLDAVVAKGNKAVMNYGMLKNNVNDIASLHISLDIGEELSNRLSALFVGHLREFGTKPSQKLIDETVKATLDEMGTMTGNMYRSYKKAFLSDSALDLKLFEDMAVPMVELSEHQIKGVRSTYNDAIARAEQKLEGLRNRKNSLLEEEMKNYGLTPDEKSQLERILSSIDKLEERLAKIEPIQMKQVSETIVDKANQARKLKIAQDQSRFLQIFDKFTYFLKLNMTTVVPSFHARNFLSNKFNSFLTIGSDAVNKDFQLNAWKTIKSKGEHDGMLAITRADGSVEHMSWGDVYKLAEEHDALNIGFFAEDIKEGVASEGLIKGIKGKYDPTDTKNFGLYRLGGEVGSFVENSDRLLIFASHLSKGFSPEDASRLSKEFLFDYSDLTAFEQSVMKRIIPFYTWLRKNARLQLSQMMEKPGIYRDTGKVINGIEGMTNEDDRLSDDELLGFAQDWVQLPFFSTGRHGEKVPMILNPNLPFMDLGRLPNPFNLKESAQELFTQVNPLIKTPLEQVMNKNVFFDSPVVAPSDNHVTGRLDHVMSNSALYNALKKLVSVKDTQDLSLGTMNNLLGVKVTDYNVQGVKNMQKRNESLSEYNPLLDAIKRLLGGD